MIFETNPLLEHWIYSHLHGFWWVGFHEEKKVAEEEELKSESHESRERPSWFKAKMAGNMEMLRKMKNIVIIALLDMMRLVLTHLILAKNFGLCFLYDR